MVTGNAADTGLRDVGKSISKDERDEYCRRSEIFRHWLLEKVFERTSKVSVTIMILPIEVGKLNHRDSGFLKYSFLSSH